MVYVLGVDLGTTYTAAAVVRDGRAEIFPLGRRQAAVPSVVYVGPDRVLVGEAAVQRALDEPERVAREFKRRVGDRCRWCLGVHHGRPSSCWRWCSSGCSSGSRPRRAGRPATWSSATRPTGAGGSRTCWSKRSAW